MTLEMGSGAKSSEPDEDQMVITAGPLRWRAALLILPILLLAALLGSSRVTRLVKEGQGVAVSVTGIATVILLAALVGYAALAIRNFKIVSGGGRLRVTNWRGHVSEIQWPEIKEVVIRRIQIGGSSSYRYALVIARDGSVFAKLGAEGRASDRLLPLWKQIGLTPDENVKTPVKALKMRRAYPGSVSWITAHTRWTAVVVTLAIIALVIGLQMAPHR